MILWTPTRLFSIARYVRTIRHLRARQFAYQILHRLRRNHRLQRCDSVQVPAPRLRWHEGADFPAPNASTANNRHSISSGSLEFLNKRKTLGFPPDWNATSLPRLWLYNLHYHEFLWQLEFEQSREVVTDWIVNYRHEHSRVGWEVYPTSLRLTNWCTFFFGHYRSRTLADEGFQESLWKSLYEQSDHLQRNMEWHLLGNHLLENAVTLALVGSCFDHPVAGSWFRKGYEILKRELPEQILADGGHFERSPMYQSRILYVLLLLCEIGDRLLTKLVHPFLEPMAVSLAAMTHPDDEIALFNDSAFGVYPRLRELGERFGIESPKIGSFALKESGYYGVRTVSGHYVICDAGPIGPDYQPGHGHADFFSFEMSLRGSRVVVDSGVSTYQSVPMRNYCRSTRAHNTVEIADQDQVELWAAFRVGRRCRPQEVEWKELAYGFELSGHHDGYRHLPGRPRHTRTFRWHEKGRLDIFDQVNSERPLRSKARLHFHPDCRIDEFTGKTCELHFSGGCVRVSWLGWETVTQDESFYCPQFGVELSNPCLAFSSLVANLEGTIRIELL